MCKKITFTGKESGDSLPLDKNQHFPQSVTPIKIKYCMIVCEKSCRLSNGKDSLPFFTVNVKNFTGKILYFSQIKIYFEVFSHQNIYLFLHQIHIQLTFARNQNELMTMYGLLQRLVVL